MNSRGAFTLAVWAVGVVLGYATFAGLAFCVVLGMFLGLRRGRDILMTTVVDECRKRFAASERKMLLSIAFVSAWMPLLVLIAAASAKQNLAFSLIAALSGQLFATFIIIAIALKSQRKAERP
jgi:hypothetical protein